MAGCKQLVEAMETDARPFTPPSGQSNVDVSSSTLKLEQLSIPDTPKSRRAKGRSKYGDTPRVKLHFGESQPRPSMSAWTDHKLAALVEFVMLFTDGKSWVAHKDDRFWKEAGLFVQRKVQSVHCRTGNHIDKCILYSTVISCHVLQEKRVELRQPSSWQTCSHHHVRQSSITCIYILGVLTLKEHRHLRLSYTRIHLYTQVLIQCRVAVPSCHHLLQKKS